jgi:DNA modification methylase
MRVPGENAEPIAHTHEEFPVQLWQRYASPVWDDINPNDTLEFRTVREDDDERHICPLQLEVIRRAMMLWTNPGDLVLSPFAGIGSEGWVALEEGRRFVGIELKRAYWERACRNLTEAHGTKAMDLFA